MTDKRVIYIYIELKVLTTNFGRQRAFEMRTIFEINVYTCVELHYRKAGVTEFMCKNLSLN